jgi:hypothetical protein
MSIDILSVLCEVDKEIKEKYENKEVKKFLSWIELNNNYIKTKSTKMIADKDTG